MIFQVEKYDLDHEDTIFIPEDIGMWVIVIDGILCGRFGTREDAVSVYREVWFNHHS
jgi:hypothetical protein